MQTEHKPPLNPSKGFVLVVSRHPCSYTSEPAWLWAGTMMATAPVRVSVDELVCGDAAVGGIWGWAPSVLLDAAGLRKTCGGAPLALGRLCFRDGVPPTL